MSILKTLTICSALLFLSIQDLSAQPQTLTDSLLKRLANSNDTGKVNALNDLCWAYRNSQPEKALDYGQQALKLATSLQFQTGLVRANSRVGVIHMNQGNYPLADSFFQKALVISQASNNLPGLASTYMNLGNINFYQNEYQPAVENFAKASKIYERLGDSSGIVNCMNNTSNIYFAQGNFTKALEYQFIVLRINRNLKNKDNEAMCLDNIGAIYSSQGDLPRALQNHLAALKLTDSLQNKQETASIYINVGAILCDMGKFEEALGYFTNSLKLNEELGDKRQQINSLNNVANAYNSLEKLSLSRDFYEKGLVVAQDIKDIEGIAAAQSGLGSVLSKQNKLPEALEYYKKALVVQKQLENRVNVLHILKNMSYIYGKMGQPAEALKAASESVEVANKTESLTDMKEANFALSSAYKGQKNYEKALQYYETASVLKDSVLNQSNAREIGRLESGYELDKKDQQITLLNKDKIIDAAKASRQALLRNALIAGLFLIIVLAFVLIRNNQHKQRTNMVLTGQQKEIESKRDSLEKALTDLKASQAQLIQSEKMASLGQLTAGIAHEIQNPLNFVNNFSDVNNEMIVEAKEELAKGNVSDVNMLLSDIADNAKKISFHGKRADSIVKSMLEHSRSSAGSKEPTDINALADEYLRLAYHGLQRKDESVQVTMQTHFDPQIGKIDLVPQEIGKVLLNLYNNAFYSVTEKQKRNIGNYDPTIVVSTRIEKDKVSITVRDNGNGVPQNIIDKIFQPFFTTKPTGQGTGLGLSLSYDIIKAAGGDIKVDSVEDEYTQFVVTLPASSVHQNT